MSVDGSAANAAVTDYPQNGRRGVLIQRKFHSLCGNVVQNGLSLVLLAHVSLPIARIEVE